jgi:hypothetical protein
MGTAKLVGSAEGGPAGCAPSACAFRLLSYVRGSVHVSRSRNGAATVRERCMSDARTALFVRGSVLADAISPLPDGRGSDQARGFVLSGADLEIGDPRGRRC